MKIPYGISNFELLRDRGFYYIDKTKYIEILENMPYHQFLIRPRRFGKSLFISMLENYYDINKKDKFDKLFGDLYIGKHPTPEVNSYLVLKLSFAGIVTSAGKEKLVETFEYNIKVAARDFFKSYKNILGEVDIEGIHDAVNLIKEVIFSAKTAKQKVYLFLDEYDNFANELIGKGNKNLYYDLMTTEGYVKAFYKAIKDGTAVSISRVYMTGVSPIMLDDLTSGFNITHNLTMDESVNEIMGVTKNELSKILDDFNIHNNREQIEKDMKYFYNGYLFSDMGQERLYNTDMMLYFLNSLVDKGVYPKQILDNNVKTDYRKLQEMALNFKDDETLTLLINDEEIETKIIDRFNLESIYKDKENFVSLLYYMGMLTIKEKDENQVRLGVPNYVIKSIYWECFLSKIKEEFEINNNELKSAIKNMRKNGDIKEFLSYIQKTLEVLSNRDLQKFDEKYIKVLIITLLMVDGIYVVDSEYESGGYVDLLLFKDARYREYTNFEWLIELKYLKESERKSLDSVRIKGIDQIKRYANSEKVTRRLEAGFKKIVLIFVGKKDVYLDEI